MVGMIEHIMFQNKTRKQYVKEVTSPQHLKFYSEKISFDILSTQNYVYEREFILTK